MQFKMEMLGKLYKSAKFLYDCGNYQAASQYLYFVRVLVGGVVVDGGREVCCVDGVEVGLLLCSWRCRWEEFVVVSCSTRNSGEQETLNR